MGKRKNVFISLWNLSKDFFVQFLSRVKSIKNVVTSFGVDLKRFGHFRS